MPTVTIGNNSGNDYAGLQDVFLAQSTPTTNQEGGTYELDIGKYTAGNYNMGLVRVTGISSLPSGLTVTSATLSAYLGAIGGADHVITAKKCNRAWGESTATYNTWDGSNSWTTAGGLHEADDRSATISGVSGSIETAGFYWSLIADASQFRADIEGFRSGALTNNGWQLERTDGADDSEYRAFYGDNGSDGQRPYLSVTYTESAASVVPGIMQQMSDLSVGDATMLAAILASSKVKNRREALAVLGAYGASLIPGLRS